MYSPSVIPDSVRASGQSDEVFSGFATGLISREMAGVGKTLSYFSYCVLCVCVYFFIAKLNLGLMFLANGVIGNLHRQSSEQTDIYGDFAERAGNSFVFHIHFVQ